ncbi:MAG TPA: hypothetical protein VFS44_10720 [Gemmatimonadaceae bacterium]|nr:hypothetical protein [Gemmatimonadaceae bacterium]
MPRRSSFARAVLSALLPLALAAPPAAGQIFRPGIRPTTTQSTVYLGISGAAAVPQGQFKSYVGTGWGVQSGLLVRLDPSGVLGLRVDAGFINYGNEKKRACISTTIGCRIEVDVHTRNNIAIFGIGPQLMLPTGTLRPYLTGTVGLAYFFTQSSLSGISDNQDFANTTNFDDATFAWTGGGGVYIPLRRKGKPISLDLGVRYHGNGEARYLREGSIVDNPDGSITYTPIRSQTNLLIFSVGATFGL